MSKNILIVIVLALLAAGVYGIRNYTQKEQKLETHTPITGGLNEHSTAAPENKDAAEPMNHSGHMTPVESTPLPPEHGTPVASPSEHADHAGTAPEPSAAHGTAPHSPAAPASEAGAAAPVEHVAPQHAENPAHSELSPAPAHPGAPAETAVAPAEPRAAAQ